MQPQQAYQQMQQLATQAELIANRVKKHFQYNPFEHAPYTFKRDLSDIREKLIEHFTEIYRLRYTPNLKASTTDIKTAMNETVGRDGFDYTIIKNHFRALAKNKRELRKNSLDQIRRKAKHFVPGGYYNPPKLADMLDGNLLTIRAYTWRDDYPRGSGSLSWSMNSNEEFNALDQLIAIATLRANPCTVPAGLFTTHWKENKTAELFYGKHAVTHDTIEAFQFFKNEKFRIWFKTEDQARKVARALLA